MEKIKANRRDIQFYSQKNEVMLIVHTYEAKHYAEQLEQSSAVIGYWPCKPLLPEQMAYVNPVEIRKEYRDNKKTGEPVEWESDFLIEFAAGRKAIREIVRVEKLKDIATVEQLELSRRYWSVQGIKDWQIVIFQKAGVDQEDADYVL